MKVELEYMEVEYIKNLLHDRYYIYSNKDPMILEIMNKLEMAADDAWNQYVLSKTFP